MLYLAIYIGLVVLLTIAVVVATSDRYRSRYPWLVQDEPEDGHANS